MFADSQLPVQFPWPRVLVSRCQFIARRQGCLSSFLGPESLPVVTPVQGDISSLLALVPGDKVLEGRDEKRESIESLEVLNRWRDEMLAESRGAVPHRGALAGANVRCFKNKKPRCFTRGGCT